MMTHACRGRRAIEQFTENGCSLQKTGIKHPILAKHVIVCVQLDDEIPDNKGRNSRDFGDNMDRLIEVKQKYDPSNLFRKNENLVKTPKAKL